MTSDPTNNQSDHRDLTNNQLRRPQFALFVCVQACHNLHKDDWQNRKRDEQDGTPATTIAQGGKDVRCFQGTRDAQIAGRNGASQKLNVVCIRELLSVRCVSQHSPTADR